jgi:enoyl-CoA hydratase/carnithine racemase
MIGPRMCRAWEEMEQITICAIEGHCVGGALALAVACDFRVMGGGARLKIPELKLGLNLSWQSIPRMVSLVGPAMAKKMVLLGEQMSAEEALKCGFAQELADDGKALDSALNMAEKIAQMPPLPVKMTKQSINAIANALNHVSSYMDTDQSIVCQMTQDHKEGMEAFLKRRPPAFKGS